MMSPSPEPVSAARRAAESPSSPLPEGDHARRVAGRIVGVTPFERPDAGLVANLCRAGALGVLDLGRDAGAAQTALAKLGERGVSGFGVRVPEGVDPSFVAKNGAIVAVVVAQREASPETYAAARAIAAEGAALLAQVTSIEEARAAAALGADGLFVKGSESGGAIGEETSFVLLQRVIAELSLPLWVQGGVGLHTAAACLAGGAHGVVLDAQLACLRESSLPETIQAAVRAMDGSETAVLAGIRVLTRPDLLAAKLEGAPRAKVLSMLGAGDLTRDVVPAGQDAAFAGPLAARFPTAFALVFGLREAIAAHLAAARTEAPLGPRSALAREHGVRYPIAQGPMTRVSDRAAFAEAVATAGALPFLALSLMRGPEVKALLEETRKLAEGRPFGVGILGFVPEEAREEQLAAIREVPPRVAIIAGGRPAQAKPLEAQGIATYLHVPSPGLLDLFLAEGARRFVFEGRECGGHVGPRTSFVLWEMQIERLLAFLDAEDAASQKGQKTAENEAIPLSVLFAGGIHDARSAAMVAAMAAPLASRGAAIGVLMGTAYLFTEEAVATRAIAQGFQDEAIACERTALLETAPGHATRCVESDYVRDFAEEKQRLIEAKTSHEAMWATLEQKNLGRLRIAAKGLRREGSVLVAVDGATQRREGMYMIGQVAALRHARCTMAELHRDVCDGATERLADLTALEDELSPAVERPKQKPADVAIIGMACVFPGASDLDAYWANIAFGRNAITEVDKERWDPAVYFDPTSMNGDKTPSKWGGFIDPVPFDPLAYGIPPKSLSAIEPVQLLSLEVARRALEDAGYARRPFDRERTSVIFGAEGGTDLSSAYGFRALFPQYAGALPKALDDHLPVLTEDSFPGVLANVIAGRIANRLDLGGVNYTVDAACASSIAAVDLAVKELATGGSDLVLCGGADLHNGIHDYLMFSSVHALSPTGQCKTFDASADGIVLGEGVACVVLKRLADAERDGDRVYAVIKGVAGGSDGRSLGLTAPRKEGQVRAVERAYARAGITPSDVALIEAHGTGTVVGDRTELATLTEVFESAGASIASCTLGSVKSQIGHTKCAAGLAGLIKAALAIHHRVLPPTLNLRKPNPFYDATTSPFTLSDVARPWAAERRLAGVSAFGFGGTNFHCIVESHDVSDKAGAGVTLWPVELFLLRGASAEIAARTIDRLLSAIASGEPLRLRDLALTVSAGKGKVYAAIVASDLSDLADKLRDARARLTSEEPGDEPLPEGVFVASDDAQPIAEGQIAFLFPGQGSQRPGMLRELFVAFPSLHRLLRLGAPWAARMLPPSALTPSERSAQVAALTDTRVAQPALGLADLAMAELLASVGVAPDMVGGHSYGELVALTVAGALSEPDLLALSEARAAAILGAAGDDAGAMAAVSASEADVAQAIEGITGVVIANQNAPDQTVIAGPSAAIEQALGELEDRGLSARKIQVACAFHSPVVAAARTTLGAHLEGVFVAPPRIPVWSNTTAVPYPNEPDAIRARIADHVAERVRFVDEIRGMHAAGARIFVEVGPGRVLSGLVSRILKDEPHRAIPCDRGGGSGLPELLHALAELATLGAPVDVRSLFEGRDAKRIDLDKPPRLRPAASAWLVSGAMARPLSGEIPKGGLKPLNGPLLGPMGAAQSAPEGESDAVVVEYLRGMRELARSQRDVMLRFLGSAPIIDATLEDAPDDRARTARITTAIEVRETADLAPVSLAPMSAADTLLGIVSDRTGYPIEMLDLDLNLEAELSIDSIKRIEILGVLSARMGLSSEGSEQNRGLVEELARVKTLRGILDWLDAHGPSSEAAGAPSEAAAPAPPRITIPSPAPTMNSAAKPPNGAHALTEEALGPRLLGAPHAVVRCAVRLVDTPIDARHTVAIAGRSYALIAAPSDRVGAVIAALAMRGASARVVFPHESLDGFDGVVHLSPLDHEGALAPSDATRVAADAFECVQRAVAARVRSFVAATWVVSRSDDASRAALAPLGLSGLLRSAAREATSMTTRVVGLERSASIESQAAAIAIEIATDADAVEVIDVGGARLTRVVEATPLPERPRARPPIFGPDAVVIVTGGARGITARIATAVAERFGGHLEIVGRSELPAGPEADFLRGAEDARAVRRALIARGDHKTPSAIEAACARVLADREMRSTLAAIDATNATVRYRPLDVRDEAALGSLIDTIYAERGRIDAVIHGAGVLDDKRLADKTRASFERVFDTKVSAALTFARKLRPETRLVAFFASIAGAFGNAGQTDYAAANDALGAIAWSMRETITGRAVAFDWGPWAGTGMVSPELERAYEKRGLGLIDPSDGVAAFFDELEASDDAEVVMLRAGPTDPLAAFRAEGAEERDAAASDPPLNAARIG